MNSMIYKGYAARIEYDAQDRIFVGHLAGIRDAVGFHSGNVDGLETAFHEAVDDYANACKRLHQKPERPANGEVLLPVSPEPRAPACSAKNQASDQRRQRGRSSLPPKLITSANQFDQAHCRRTGTQRVGPSPLTHAGDRRQPAHCGHTPVARQRPLPDRFKPAPVGAGHAESASAR